MTEDLNLPPDVRAVQEDALRPIEPQWTCDYCDGAAAFGARRRCCKAAVVMCLDHCRQHVNEIAGARVAGYASVCPDCNQLIPWPVTSSAMFEYDRNLMKVEWPKL
jgi:hypothetical protein